MARVGSVEVYTESAGWVEIELYDPSDFTFAPFELQAANGNWGVPNLATTAGEADTPLEVYTATHGWVGVNTTGFVLIDDFESADMDDAWNTSSASGIDATSARAAYQGNYGAHITTDTYENLLAHPDYTVNLPYYPEPGDVIDIYMRGRDGAFEAPHTHDNPIRPLQFGIQEYPAEDDDDWNTGDFWNDYVVWIREDLDPKRFQISREDQNEHPNAEWDDIPDDAFVDDQWYRVEADWHHSVAGDITARAWEVHDDGSESPVLDVNGDPVSPTITDDTWGRGGIALSGINEMHYDWVKKTAPL